MACHLLPSQVRGKGVKVNLLDGGSFSTSTSHLLHEGSAPDAVRLYDWCFHIYHESSNRHVLWDLGCTQVSFISPKTPGNITHAHMMKN